MAVQIRGLENASYTVLRLGRLGYICANSRGFPANRPGPKTIFCIHAVHTTAAR